MDILDFQILSWKPHVASSCLSYQFQPINTKCNEQSLCFFRLATGNYKCKVPIETPTPFVGGNGISIGGLYLARLQTLFSVITSARFTCVSQDHLARGHSHPSTCVRKLRFSGLFRGVLPPDNCWPDGGLTLSEILPKTGLVTIVASRSTESGPDPSPPLHFATVEVLQAYQLRWFWEFL